MRVPPYRLCPLIYFRSYNIGRRRASSGTHLPPPRAQRSEIFSRMCSTPLPRKAKPTMSCRAPVVRLVTVPVSCLDTAAIPGEKPPQTPPLEHRLFAQSQYLSRAWTQKPPPPRARPLVLGHRFCLVLGHSRRAGGGHPPLERAPSCWDTYLFTYF